MKKRELFFRNLALLTLAGALLLSGCKKAAGDASEAEEPSGSVQTEENAQSEIQEPLTYEEPPEVTADICRGERYAEDGTLLVAGSYEAPSLTGSEFNEAYGTLRAAFEDWALDQDELFEQTMEQYETYAGEHLESVGAEFFNAYGTEIQIGYTRVDTSVVSFRQYYWDYAGGAHGNYGYDGVTFEAVSGERLALRDLMTDEAAMERFCAKAADYCVDSVKKQYPEGLFEDYEEVICQEFSSGQEPNWYMDAAGITFVYNPYEIGPYATGAIFVTFPYEEAADFLKPQYCGFQGAGVAELTPGVEAALLLPGQEETVPVELKLVASEEEGVPPSLSITAGRLTDEIEMLEYVENAEVVRRMDGSVLLLFDIDVASDDYVTLVYALTGEELRKTAELGASIDTDNVRLDSLKLKQRIDVLGTYTVAADYRIEADGALTLESDWYEIVRDTYGSVITAVREIPAVADGEDMLLPAGSRLQLLGTDNEGIVRFLEVSSGIEGELYFTRGEEGWPIYIDGVEENAYFENLPYAG